MAHLLLAVDELLPTLYMGETLDARGLKTGQGSRGRIRRHAPGCLGDRLSNAPVRPYASYAVMPCS